MTDLAGKVALVTGAGSGLGEATAKLLAERGARVGLLGRTEDELLEVKKAIGTSGLVLPADVSKEADVRDACNRLATEYGTLDIVFANAGINGVWAPLQDLKFEEWRETLAINLDGTFLTLKYSVPYLMGHGGSVIITSSVNGTRMFSNTGATAYSCSKAAQVAMAKMLALELAKHRIRVNVICPGRIESEIRDNTEKRNVEQVEEKVEYKQGEIPLTRGEAGTAEQVAQLVAFLASEESTHITGTEIFIDGAQSLLVG
ncbi:MAG: Glucose 1-dehydrogenase [Fimbriimonadaceae bacterium]|nr:Glucose 1-dehydrogenase [Fimbriimonadaceae bacterium]